MLLNNLKISFQINATLAKRKNEVHFSSRHDPPHKTKKIFLCGDRGIREICSFLSILFKSKTVNKEIPRKRERERES